MTLYGREYPRLYTPPARELTRETSLGFEVIDFAGEIGWELIPWEEWALIHALELKPNGMLRFLTVLIIVARQNGKTTLKQLVTLWRMFKRGVRLCVGTAQDLGLAKIVMEELIEVIEGNDVLAARLAGGGVRWAMSQERFWLDNGSTYRIKAMNRRATRGLSVDELNIDELREQLDWYGWASASKTTNARTNAQRWLMSNAGDDTSVVLNHLRSVALSGEDPSMFIAEWSAPDGCELDDRDAWAQANPGLGYLIDEATIESALRQDPPHVFRTEVLCQKVPSLSSAIDLDAWTSIADPAGSMADVRDRLGLVVDVAPDGVHTSATVAAALTDGRVRVEIVGQWDSTAEARRAIPELVGIVGPQRVGWFPNGPGAVLDATMQRIKGPELVPIKGHSVAEACMLFADLANHRRVLHPDDRLLNAHIGRAGRSGPDHSWVFTRPADGPTDAAYGAAGSTWLVLTAPEPVVRPKPRVILPTVTAE